MLPFHRPTSTDDEDCLSRYETSEATPPDGLRRVGLRRVFLYGGAAGLAVLSTLAAGLHVIGHDDLWWDLAAGRYIVENGTIPTTDVFSHTFAGQPWINLEWLSQVLFYGVYHLLGPSWLIGLRIGLIFLIFGIALVFCHQRSGSWLLSLLTVAFGAWVCQPFLDARPQLFTFLYSILLLWILHRFRRGGRDLLWWVPLLLLVWTQQHNGYLFGLLLLLGNLLAEGGKRLFHLPADPLTWAQWRRLGVVTVLSAAAVLVNPWTVEAYTHPLSMSKLLGSSSLYLTVAEWSPPKPFTDEFFNPIQFWWFLLLAVVVTLPVAAVRWRSFDLNDVGLALVLAVFFALQHRRFIPLFTILTLPLLSWSLRFWIDWWVEGRREATWEPGRPLAASARRRLRRPALAAAAAAWLLLALLLPVRLLAWRAVYAGETLFRTNTEASFFPAGAVRFVDQAAVPGRMFNLYNWGGYLEFFLPGHGTFIDGRAQMVFDDRFYREYLRVHYAEAGWEEVLDRHGVTWALVHRDRNAALFRAMDEDRRWSWVFADGDSAVLLAEGPENREILSRWRARQLPLPNTALTAFLYGRGAYADGDFARAVEDFDRACGLAPEDDEMRAHYLLALAAAGRIEAARREAGFAVKEFPDSVAVHLATARVEQRAGREEEAFTLYAEVSERWPSQRQAIDGMLAIDPERGRQRIEEAYRKQPDGPWRSWAVGRLAERSGDFEAARRLYQAEGANAARAGDRERLLQAKRAFDRTRDRREEEGDAELGSP